MKEFRTKHCIFTIGWDKHFSIATPYIGIDRFEDEKEGYAVSINLLIAEIIWYSTGVEK